MQPKPHEMAILLLYPQFRSVSLLQAALRYKDPSPIQKVLKKHRNLLPELMTPMECRNESSKLAAHEPSIASIRIEYIA